MLLRGVATEFPLETEIPLLFALCFFFTVRCLFFLLFKDKDTEVNHLTTNSSVHLLQTGINNRVEPLVSGHPKCEELLVAYRKCLLARVELQEIFNKEKSRYIHFLEWMYCMQFLGYNNLNPCFFLKFPHTLSNHNTYQGGVLRISSDRDDLKGTKIKPPKNPPRASD